MTCSNGMTRWANLYQIKLQCDTNAACSRMTDDELVACYNEVFGIKAPTVD
jgi:hypothetical protein